MNYKRDIQPYLNSSAQPIFTINSWKLGEQACLEKDYKFIYHDGRAEKNWKIENDMHYYLVGDGESNLKEGDKDNFDFKLNIKRDFYPWGNIFNKFLASYEIKVEFKNGGAQEVLNTRYPHIAPVNGYFDEVTIKYKGAGDVSASHSKRYFINVGGRLGIMNFWVVPSRNVMFEYLLNRKNNDINLNIPSFVAEHGESSDYFSCGSSASVIKPQTTKLGACANLGGSRIGC